ncbi:MAG: cation:dicarboxylase symporter family transporter, partial [Deltaproteobacteria bacterium]|nr:cation:dicarboxylase symporter family transporter [Deltaproteobacteria bacterium]
MVSYKKILLGLFVGTAAGLCSHFFWSDAPALGWILQNIADPTGKIFLKLIFMMVVPIIFSAIALGIAAMSDLKTLGRIGLRTLLYTIIVSSIAVFIGILLVNCFEPGAGFTPEQRAELLRSMGKTFSQTVAPPQLGASFLVD